MERPLVSCIIPTMPSRRRFIAQAFAMFERQTYPNKELIVVDNSEEPLEAPPWVRVVRALGVHCGQACNVGVQSSQADYFHKWDDDDWYGPDFLEALIPPLVSRLPVVSVVDTHLVFLVSRWEIRITPGGIMPGGTICWNRQAWEQHPWDPIRGFWGEDTTFIFHRPGLVKVTQPPWHFALVRHGENSWREWDPGVSVEEKFGKDSVLSGGPEEFFSPEDLQFYRRLAVSIPKAA